MTKSPLYLTKSKFKTGHECKNKLYFMKDKTYASTMDDNDFLKALAEGGFQVGELAKIYKGGGISIDTLNKDEAIKQTAELLEKDIVTIYEAAFLYKGFFIRVDIVEKRGQFLKLTEVKSKTYDFSDPESSFLQKRDKTKLDTKWEPYLLDVAFQSFVVRNAFPEFKFTWSLMMPDNSKVASVDGINQRFFIIPAAKDGKRVEVQSGTNIESLGDKLLGEKIVDSEIEILLSRTDYDGNLAFEAYASKLHSIYQSSEFPNQPVSRDCKTCEYRIGSEAKRNGMKSGFDKCFNIVAKIPPTDLEKPFVFDVRYISKKADEYLERQEYLIERMDGSLIEVKEREDDKSGWSRTQRQHIQIQSVQKNSKDPIFLEKELREEIQSWTKPFHFIDFETSGVAIPFNRGRRPYEQVAFQFSHHIVDDNDEIQHAGQYLHMVRGEFPNFDFIRALKKQLENDGGTIFRYSHHENTILREIRQQLIEAETPEPDFGDLISFIDSITYWKDKNRKQSGPRCMVDLCDVVERLYHHPSMGGSTSIKKVLPAILNHSRYLQDKYSKPIYGAPGGIVSLNYLKPTAWVQLDGDKVLDPYKQLPKVFDDFDLESLESPFVSEELKDGGAAMTAFARMQFSQMDPKTIEKVRSALLRYCELDTFAMVLIWEYFSKDLLAVKGKRRDAA